MAVKRDIPQIKTFDDLFRRYNLDDILVIKNSLKNYLPLSGGDITDSLSVKGNNVLDEGDFEYDNWDPLIIDSNGNTGIMNTTNTYGFYQRTGKNIQIYAHAQLTSKNTLSANIRIDNLPYQAYMNSAYGHGGVFVKNFYGLSSAIYGGIFGEIQRNSDLIIFRCANNGTAMGYLTAAMITDSFYVYFLGDYQIQ